MQNDDFNIDVVIAEITAFAENMHAKNQHKKKVCLRCMMIIPLVLPWIQLKLFICFFG